MFDAIILMTGAAERPIFASVLSTHNPCLTIISVETLAELNALEPDRLARARLIAYGASVIVPADVAFRAALPERRVKVAVIGKLVAPAIYRDAVPFCAI